MLFKANSAICQLYHGESKLIFNEMIKIQVIFDVELKKVLGHEKMIVGSPNPNGSNLYCRVVIFYY